MKKNKTILKLILLSFVMVCITGCGSSSGVRRYVHPEADFSIVNKVAVIPFDNLTRTDLAGEQVTGIFITELLIGGYFNVIEPGEVNKVLSDFKIKTTVNSKQPVKVDIKKIKKIGEALQAQTIIFGTVEQYEMQRFGSQSYPVVALGVRMVDAETGTVMWSASYSDKGGPGIPFLSIGEVYTLSRLTQRVCSELVKSLTEYIYD